MKKAVLVLSIVFMFSCTKENENIEMLNLSEKEFIETAPLKEQVAYAKQTSIEYCKSCFKFI